MPITTASKASLCGVALMAITGCQSLLDDDFYRNDDTINEQIRYERQLCDDPTRKDGPTCPGGS